MVYLKQVDSVILTSVINVCMCVCTCAVVPELQKQV